MEVFDHLLLLGHLAQNVHHPRVQSFADLKKDSVRRQLRKKRKEKRNDTLFLSDMTFAPLGDRKSVV